jgi:hypothetical protein
MPSLKEAIEKNKRIKDKATGDVTAFILERVEEIASLKFEEFKKNLLEDANKKVSDFTDLLKNEILEIKSSIKNGYTPQKGKDYFDGKPGANYILTPKDKEEIAGSIAVPTVTKLIERIVEKPIVTEVKNEIIKEVAVTDKPEVIAKKLNKLEQKVNKSVIKDLEDDLRNISKSLREVSRNSKASITKGGMGNWVHQRFSTSSVTTTLALTNNIGAGGLAHIFRYNGQVQDYGTDYTINGKTITLLFTLDDNSVCSIAYVRK